ncbi:hypothetical protein TWF696_003787 [Orbilia brochopaga]|uniref:Heterokaryon incompatibility domain-containing protein n=1 Tax=Orbilia brochopaga TaxID=3140254 RepID=A0AAV9V6T5_9PEZI
MPPIPRPGYETRRLELIFSATPPSPRTGRLVGGRVTYGTTSESTPIHLTTVRRDPAAAVCVEYHNISPVHSYIPLALQHPEDDPDIPRMKYTSLLSHLQYGIDKDGQNPSDFLWLNSVLLRFLVSDFHEEIRLVGDPDFERRLFEETVKLVESLPSALVYFNWLPDVHEHLVSLEWDPYNPKPHNHPELENIDDNTLVLAAQIALFRLKGQLPPWPFLRNMKSYVMTLGETLALAPGCFQYPLQVAWQRFNNLLFYAVAQHLCSDSWSLDLLEITSMQAVLPPIQTLLLGESEDNIHENICPRAVAVLVSSPAGKFLDYRVFRDYLTKHLEYLPHDSRRGLLNHTECTSEVCEHHKRQSEEQSDNNPNKERDKKLAKLLHDQTQHECILGSRDALDQKQRVSACQNSRLKIDLACFAAVRQPTDPPAPVGRVVDIRATEDTLSTSNPRLLYCRFSTLSRTLAVTHVWAHGQGGSPEDGFNRCLHKRYVALAARLGCDSYWIDSACIPENESFRTEAIMTLNPIFSGAKVVLVVDRLIQTIEHTDSELLLAALTMSDWNTRSWTFFEGVMSSGHLYLLCKSNQVVSLQQVCADIMDRHANASLAIGMIALQHIFLSAQPAYIGNWRPYGQARSHVFERTGCALALRRASRDGDDRRIWALLLHGEKYFPDDGIDERLCRTRDGSGTLVRSGQTHSGFLLSDMPRLSEKSWGPDQLHWYPFQPTARWTTGDGEGSSIGLVLEDGSFFCNWLVRDLTLEDLKEIQRDTPPTDSGHGVVKLAYSPNLVSMRPMNQVNSQYFGNAAMVCERMPYGSRPETLKVLVKPSSPEEKPVERKIVPAGYEHFPVYRIRFIFEIDYLESWTGYREERLRLL